MPRKRRITEKSITPLVALSVSLTIFIVDQLTKFIIQHFIPLGTSVPVIRHIFHLTLVFNQGAAFGIFKTQNALFVTIAFISIFFIVCYFPRLSKKDFFVRVGLAFILGGLVGNLVDRLRLRYVVDFLDFRIWPVFNIADVALTIGTIMLILGMLKRTEEKRC